MTEASDTAGAAASTVGPATLGGVGAAPKPAVGRIVHVTGHQDVETNNRDNHSAIITHVWSAVCVNLTVFLDDGGIRHLSSVTDHVGSSPRWFWPPRV